MDDKTTRPQPPADLTDPERVEWDRICREVESCGRTLKSADRSILQIYVRTWLVYTQCSEHVRSEGAVMTWPNGLSGPSPEYKTMRETAQLLRGVLADLGATPASRDFDQDKQPADAPRDLQF